MWFTFVSLRSKYQIAYVVLYLPFFILSCNRITSELLLWLIGTVFWNPSSIIVFPILSRKKKIGKEINYLLNCSKMLFGSFCVYPLQWPECQGRVCLNAFLYFFPSSSTHTYTCSSKSFGPDTSLFGWALYGFYFFFLLLHSVNCLLSVLAHPLVFCKLPMEKRLVSKDKEVIWLRVGLTVAVAHDKHLLQYSWMRTLLSKLFTAHFEPFTLLVVLFFPSSVTKFFQKAINP